MSVFNGAPYILLYYIAAEHLSQFQLQCSGQCVAGNLGSAFVMSQTYRSGHAGEHYVDEQVCVCCELICEHGFSLLCMCGCVAGRCVFDSECQY